MDKLQEHFEEMKQLIDLETNEIRILEGKKLTDLKSMLQMNWEPEPIYYNGTNLIITDVNDYTRIKGAAPKFEDVLKLEMPEFNCYLYIGRWINVEFLKNILAGGL